MRTTYALAGLVASVAAKTYVVTETKDVTITSCAPSVTDCPGQWGDWEGWSSTKPVDPVKPTTWSEWKDTKSTKPVDPAKPSTWSAWKDVTSTKPVDPAKPTTWAQWTSTKPADPVKPSTWSEWKGVTTTKPVDANKPTTWAEWKDTSSYACPSYTATAAPEWFSQLPSDVRSSVEAKWTGGPPKDWCYYTYSTPSAVKTSTTPYAPVGTGSATWGSWNPTSVAPVAKYTGAASMNGVSMGFAGIAGLAAVMLA